MRSSKVMLITEVDGEETDREIFSKFIITAFSSERSVMVSNKMSIAETLVTGRQYTLRAEREMIKEIAVNDKKDGNINE